VTSIHKVDKVANGHPALPLAPPQIMNNLTLTWGFVWAPKCERQATRWPWPPCPPLKPSVDKGTMTKFSGQNSSRTDVAACQRCGRTKRFVKLHHSPAGPVCHSCARVLAAAEWRASDQDKRE
jgi:hypothetical protein